MKEEILICCCNLQVALTVFPERPVASSTFGGVPWWIIVLSVLLGLLLLALLIFLLWKVGLLQKDCKLKKKCIFAEIFFFFLNN